MFPISDSIHSDKVPYVNLSLILLTIIIFIFQVLLPGSFTDQFSLIPSLVDNHHPLTFIPFVTAIFLHGGILHIVFNMWFLYIFGDDVEANIGHLRYLLLYFVAGIVGNIAQYLLLPTSAIPMLGASGAIAGVLGAYFILFPSAQVKTLIPVFGFLPAIINIPAPIMLGYWFLLQIISGTLALPTFADQGGVAFWAHVGGFITGIIFARLFGRRIVTTSIIKG